VYRHYLILLLRKILRFWPHKHQKFATLTESPIPKVRVMVTVVYGYCYSTLANFKHWGPPSHPLDNIQVMVIVWRIRGNIISTALCWIVWHNVHSPQHTYMGSSYRSNRLGLSHGDPHAVCRGGCLELYYCNMVQWFWWDSSLIFDDQLVSFSALTLLVWSSGL